LSQVHEVVHKSSQHPTIESLSFNLVPGFVQGEIELIGPVAEPLEPTVNHSQISQVDSELAEVARSHLFSCEDVHLTVAAFESF